MPLTIRRHTARAAGIVGTIDETTGQEYLADKISVLSAPFYTPPVVPGPIDQFPVDPWILVAAIAGLVLFLIILTVVLVLRHRRKKREEEEEEAARAAENDIDALLAAAGVVQSEAGANVMNMQTEKSMELRRDLRQFASDNPEIAAQMIKAWLRGGDENG